MQLRGNLYLESMFETNGGTRSDVKDGIKKLPENAPKQKYSEKTKMMQMIGLI